MMCQSMATTRLILILGHRRRHHHQPTRHSHSVVLRLLRLLRLVAGPLSSALVIVITMLYAAMQSFGSFRFISCSVRLKQLLHTEERLKERVGVGGYQIR